MSASHTSVGELSPLRFGRTIHMKVPAASDVAARRAREIRPVRRDGGEGVI